MQDVRNLSRDCLETFHKYRTHDFKKGFNHHLLFSSPGSPYPFLLVSPAPPLTPFPFLPFPIVPPISSSTESGSAASCPTGTRRSPVADHFDPFWHVFSSLWRCQLGKVQGCARDLSGRDRDQTRDAKVRDRDETETLDILSETRPRPRRSSSRDLGRDVW